VAQPNRTPHPSPCPEEYRASLASPCTVASGSVTGTLATLQELQHLGIGFESPIKVLARPLLPAGPWLLCWQSSSSSNAKGCGSECVLVWLTRGRMAKPSTARLPPVSAPQNLQSPSSWRQQIPDRSAAQHRPRYSTSCLGCSARQEIALHP
jgi:hypothetical protein